MDCECVADYYMSPHDCTVVAAQRPLGTPLGTMTLAGYDNAPYKVHASICDGRDVIAHCGS